MPGNTKEEVIRFATASIAKELSLDADVLADLLIDRENLEPTALSDGIGIPHARDFLLNTPARPCVSRVPRKTRLPMAPWMESLCTPSSSCLLATIGAISTCWRRSPISATARDTTDFLRMHPQKNSLLDYVKSWESRLN